MRRAARAWAGVAVVACLAGGCARQFERAMINARPQYTPSNVHRGAPELPPSLKRVAVLPMVVSARGSQAEGARASVESSLLAELTKSARFEVVPVSESRVAEWTGRGQWATTDVLPADFFARIQEGTGADAVLFPEVTTFRAYPPLAVGLRLQLVGTEGPRVWWAVDEVFDASEAEVVNAARRYHLSHAGKPLELTDSGEILYSPRRFGSYAASAVVATCPPRGETMR